MSDFITDAEGPATPLRLVEPDNAPEAIRALGSAADRWCRGQSFTGKPGELVLIPDAHGAVSAVFAGCQADAPWRELSALPRRLPTGTYVLDPAGLPIDGADAALHWSLGAYRYERYAHRSNSHAPAVLRVAAADLARARPLIDATFLVRDLVNTPTADLGPAELAGEVRNLAQHHGARYEEWVGADLLEARLPAIHAVGRAGRQSPRLARLTGNGPAGAPHLVLIGKGVCFDSGGLDLKTAEGMRWMKKDMGGAAHAIALAGLVLGSKLPVRLTLLVPTVENAVASDAYRPGEVLRTRGGISVEVDNTDAEGRLILCDALALAAEEHPDLIIDFATLTGAARVALGPDLPALFSNRDDIADALADAARATGDPLWRLPLWRPYLTMLDSHVADIANAGPSRHAGAVTAALFLERFVPAAQAWAHFDLYAWNDADRPGRPRGGEAQTLRACFEFLRRRYPVQA